MSSSPASTSDWLRLNLANWEARVPIHTGPGGYDLASFDQAEHISNVVRFDLQSMGDPTGLEVAHLQCHIGTDTVSLARAGARSVVGLDFSPAALRVGRELAARTRTNVSFVEGNVYDAVELLGAARFDLIYVSVGALCWLPDVARWARVVAGLLKADGRLFIRDGHPSLLTLDEKRSDGLLVAEFPYFETAGTVYEESETYAGSGAVAAATTVWFNHGLAEIVSAVLRAGMRLTALEEHAHVPWNALPFAMVPSAQHAGHYVLRERPERLPCTFTLQAVKPTG